MLSTLDLKLTLEKELYKQQLEALMKELRTLQQQCWQNKLPIVVVLEGWAGAGKGSLLKKITNYMDPRGFSVHPIFPPSGHEKKYPFLWRFWHKLPPKGSIAFFYHSWYTHVLEDRLFDRVSNVEAPDLMRQINNFERLLIDDGAAIAKFWIHLSNKELKKRLKKSAKDELNSWRVRPEDWQQEKNYKAYSRLVEEMLTYTSTGAAPWTLVEGDCEYWTRVKVLSQLVATIKEALDRQAIALPSPKVEPQKQLLPTEPDYLSPVDLTQSLNSQTYKKRLRNAQIELQRIQLDVFKSQIPILILFEGWDAAGKGGAIKRLTDSLDARSYKINSFAAPTTEELQHNYLWRFSRHLPGRGTIGIFDRTWYGRVLVERIEGFASEQEWRRAYKEINEFEISLTHSNYVLIKFWIHIDQEEQLKRFEQRKGDTFKGYKLTPEDWRNREQWPEYHVAVNQMIARTHTPHAPWTIIAGNDKYFARVKVLETVIDSIKAKLNA
ncbi:MAG: polyphosphate:AMP phosphotransferase [Synechococcaceae cyanobacterium RL_1_2]|nr:polyphosphate:AMP phosphotransferase [Synechococcaceae cyanobacterium RL_1_2]